MCFLDNFQIERLKKLFLSLEITGPEIGDTLFELLGPGNTLDYKDKPYERFSSYEQILKAFQEADPEKYKALHKGTPFYFMSWTAFDLKNYEKAVFYMDAALSEDIKISRDCMSRPAGKFLLLETIEAQVCKRIIKQIKETLTEQITRFNAISGRKAIFLDNDFIERFVKILIKDLPKRTIITALYTFILEFNDRYDQLKLRSSGGGSVEPFLTHFFKGGLIFESLLKHSYSKMKNNIGKIFKDPNFLDDFNLTSLKEGANSLEKILNNISDNSIKTAFETTAKLRNTTGHNLIWDHEIFDDPDNYKKLFEQQMNAIFYVISFKFLQS